MMPAHLFQPFCSVRAFSSEILPANTDRWYIVLYSGRHVLVLESNL